jgi:hypothetical protein
MVMVAGNSSNEVYKRTSITDPTRLLFTMCLYHRSHTSPISRPNTTIVNGITVTVEIVNRERSESFKVLSRLEQLHNKGLITSEHK